MFKKKPAPPALSREESLDAVVVANQAVRTKVDDQGVITLLVPFRASPMVERLSRWLGSAAQGERPVQLDEIGSFVWRMCDGKTPVRDMIQRLADQYRINRKEAETALTAFLRTLTGKGLVVIAVLKTKEGERPGP